MVIIAVAAVLIAGSIAPTDVVVTRSVLIKAARPVIMEQVTRFKSWPAWSPWHDKDSAMKITYIGQDGEPGSGYHWTGDDRTVGEGEMKNTAVSDSQMDFTINIIKPWTMDMTGTFKAKDTANGSTKVTWSVTKHTAYPFNASNLFVDIDKYLGADFEMGLAKLKKAIESNPVIAAAAQVEIKEVDFPARTYQGVRKVVNMAEMMQFFNNSLGMVAPGVGSRMAGPAVSIYYTWDMASMTTDVMAGFPVKDTSAIVYGATYAQVPASKAYMAVQRGGYSGSAAVHNALKTYMTTKGQTPGLALDEYVVSPHETADSNQWVTNVYYFIR